MNGKKIMAVVEPAMLGVIEKVTNSPDDIPGKVFETKDEIKFIVENIEFNLFNWFKFNPDRFTCGFIFKRTLESVGNSEERINAKTLGKIMLMGMSEETEYELADGSKWHVSNVTFDDMSIKDNRQFCELSNGDHYEHYPFFCIHVEFKRIA